MVRRTPSRASWQGMVRSRRAGRRVRDCRCALSRPQPSVVEHPVHIIADSGRGSPGGSKARAIDRVTGGMGDAGSPRAQEPANKPQHGSPQFPMSQTGKAAQGPCLMNSVGPSKRSTQTQLRQCPQDNCPIRVDTRDFRFLSRLAAPDLETRVRAISTLPTISTWGTSAPAQTRTGVACSIPMRAPCFARKLQGPILPSTQ
jgi:hypothetical protein